MSPGVDGGGLDDLLGLCLIGREKGSKRWLIWCHAWAWSIVWKRRQDIATILDELIAEGTLTRCEMPAGGGPRRRSARNDDGRRGGRPHRGRPRRRRRTRARSVTLGLLPDKDAVGLDPAGVAAIVDELAREGFDDAQLRAIPQGWRLTSVIKGLARKCAARTVRHGGTKLMTWCIGNVKQEPRGTSGVAITKQSAQREDRPVRSHDVGRDADDTQPGSHLAASSTRKGA